IRDPARRQPVLGATGRRQQHYGSHDYGPQDPQEGAEEGKEVHALLGPGRREARSQAEHQPFANPEAVTGSLRELVRVPRLPALRRRWHMLTGGPGGPPARLSFSPSLCPPPSD